MLDRVVLTQADDPDQLILSVCMVSQEVADLAFERGCENGRVASVSGYRVPTGLFIAGSSIPFLFSGLGLRPWLASLTFVPGSGMPPLVKEI